MKVTIDDRNPDGRGRGRADGRVALVSQAHPGETVVLRADKVTRGTLQGRVAKIETRDPDRLEHACAHEFHCTGCPLLAASLWDEARFKRGRVEAALAEVDPVLTTRLAAIEQPSEPFGYRHFAKQTFTHRDGRVTLGSYVAGTHSLTDNTGCPVLTPELAGLLERLSTRVEEGGLAIRDQDTVGLKHALARQAFSSGRQLLTLVQDHEDVTISRALLESVLSEEELVVGAFLLVQERGCNNLTAGELVHVGGETALTEELLGHAQSVGPLSFFQANPAAATAMFAAALEMAGEDERVVEGYSGVGALTLPLSDRFGSVVAIESSEEAAGALSRVASEQGRSIDVRQARVEDAIEDTLAQVAPQVAVMDPPRKGLGVEVASALASSESLQRVVLLSCEAKALTKDLPPFLERGWSLESCRPFDTFPRTAHVEVVSLLVRR
ncbi:MAG: TRAM domain-containing protein [Acidobacteriota bacterium]